MKNGLLRLLPLLVFVAVGCNDDKVAQKPSTDSSAASTTKTPDTAADKGTQPSVTGGAPATTSSSSNSNPVTPATPATSTATTTTAPNANSPAAAVPSPFQHDGYQYSGVSNTKPFDMELTMSTQPGVTTGSQTIALKETKDGKSVYDVQRTGGLANLGTEEWTVTKDGVYTTKSSMMDFGEKAMELPANPKPGMTWKVHTKSNQTNVKMDMEITFKVIGTDTVTTKVGTHKNALLVEQDGVGTLQDKKVRTVSKNWYVKGLGLVKATMNTQTGGKTESLTIQETKSQ